METSIILFKIILFLLDTEKTWKTLGISAKKRNII